MDVLAHIDYDNEKKTCCICLNSDPTYAIYKCGHKVLCETCANYLKAKGATRCPVCRALIHDIMKVFWFSNLIYNKQFKL